MTPAEYGVGLIQSWAQEKLPAHDARGLMALVAAVVSQTVREERERCARIADEGEEMEGRSGQGESGWVACRIREGTP